MATKLAIPAVNSLFGELIPRLARHPQLTFCQTTADAAQHTFRCWPLSQRTQGSNTSQVDLTAINIGKNHIWYVILDREHQLVLPPAIQT